MNVPCMLHEYDTCMSKKNGLHASIGNVHMQTCVEHACSSIYVCIMVTCMPHACSIHDTHMDIWFMHALTNLLYYRIAGYFRRVFIFRYFEEAFHGENKFLGPTVL